MKSIFGVTIRENVSLKDLNTYKIDSQAKYLIIVESIEGLINILEYLKKNNIKYFILGNGSNVVLDDYFEGAVIKLDGLNKIRINELMVEVDAGVMMGCLTMETVNNNLTGLEWAINIPGTIGGSLVGNAGAYNSSMFDDLLRIKVLTPSLEIKDIPKEDIEYGYRSTNIEDLKYIVLGCTFKLTKGNKDESLELIKTRCVRRKETQPLDLPSAGSVFRNPENDHAGRLIEEAGLKGMKVGGALVSKKHANFIVNTGNATSNDIKNLIKLVQREVKDKFNVNLVIEQKIIDWK